jgi:hypothetical protein
MTLQSLSTGTGIVELARLRAERIAVIAGSRHLRAAGQPVTVRADDEAALRYLDHLFHPESYFCGRSEPSGDGLLLEDFEVTPEQLSVLVSAVRRQAEPMGQVSPRTGDTCQVHRYGGQTFWSYQPERGGVEGPNLVVRDGARITGFTTGDRYRPMQSARLLREIALRNAQNRRWVTFHSSVVVLDGRQPGERHGILIVGRPGAGKTTTALGLCRWGGAALSVNDRAMLHLDGPEITSVPFPQPVRVLDDSLRLLGVDTASWKLVRPRREAHHKYQLMHREAAELLDVTLAGQCRISAVVTPTPDPDGEPVARESLREILTENCYTPSREPTFVDDWLHLLAVDPHDTEYAGTALTEALLGLPHLTIRHTGPDQVRSSVLGLRRQLLELLP